MRLVFLLALLSAIAGFVVNAEVIELEGTIRGIDQDSRSIAIARKTPKGEKVLELEVAKNAGDISGFKDGDTISFTYNPDVDIISQIEKVGAGSVQEASAPGHVMAVAFLPDGKRFTTGTGVVEIWNAQDLNADRVTLKHVALTEKKPHFITAVAISPTERLLASAALEGSVRLWEVSGAQPVEWAVISKNTGVVTPICFSPDGKLLATAERASGITRLFDVSEDTVKSVAVLAPADGDVWSLAFSPDGRTLVAGMWFNEAKPMYGEVVAWDLSKTPAVRHVMVAKTGLPRDIQFLPDGRSVLFGDRGLIRQVAFPDGKELAVIDCFPSDQGIVKLAISPDGKYVAAGGAAKQVKIIDIARNEESDALDADFKGVEGLAFSPDGKTLLIGSKDAKVRLWKPALSDK